MGGVIAAPVINSRAPAGRGLSQKVLFLDRDGVININFGYVHTPAKTEWLEGIFDFCRAAVTAGFSLVVVTNQAGIARGLYTEEQFIGYTRWMLEQFEEQGIHILRVYYCPHHPSAGLGEYAVSCGCRKPLPGMILAAARDLDIDLASSAMIGDKMSDMQAAQAAGVGTRILLSDEQVPQDCKVKGVRGFLQAREVLLGSG